MSGEAIVDAGVSPGALRLYDGGVVRPILHTTGQAGQYEIMLPPGLYEVIIYAEGYSEQSKQVEVNSDRTTRLNFILSAE